MSKRHHTITYVEFYAGIGGWTMALHEALQRCDGAAALSLQRLAALDHSDLCLSVLQHNLPDSSETGKKRKRAQTAAIERVTLSLAEEWNADVWAMSPPCQPHTRQHSNQREELKDPRSKSFLHLCDLLEAMSQGTLPRLLLLENVVGFESSQSCQRWRHVLQKRQYDIGHFHLTPPQVGIPNDRPRYYCIAVRADCLVTANDASEALRNTITRESDISKSAVIRTDLSELGIMPVLSETGQSKYEAQLPCIREFLDPAVAQDVDSLRVPDKLLDSSASWCFDIVTPDDRRSACFTSSYGKYIRGTGSVLYEPDEGARNNEDLLKSFQLVSPTEREFNPNWSEGLDLKRHLRFFSGQEAARLMGFPEAESKHGAAFSFPKDFTEKQRWRLLGNSLNVRVAARLCELGIRLVNWVDC